MNSAFEKGPARIETYSAFEKGPARIKTAVPLNPFDLSFGSFFKMIKITNQFATRHSKVPG